MRLFPKEFALGKYQFDIDQQESQRFKDILLYWRFYNGQHWNWQRESGEPQTTINYCKAVVDIGVDFLMGHGFTIASDKEDLKTAPSEDEYSIIDKLNEVWEDNDKENLAVELATVGGISGDAWIEVGYDEDLGKVTLTSIDSQFVRPFWDPHDKTVMLQLNIEYPAWRKVADVEGKEDMIWDPSAGEADLEKYTYRKIYTNEKIRTYHDELLVDEVDNPVGLIPIVHIQNVPTSGNYGISDLKDIVALNRELNEKTTEACDIINYHAAPTTIIYGARASTMEKGAKKIWSGLPTDARVENLELQGNLEHINSFMETMKTYLLDVASIPAHAFGEQQNVSNTSAVALEMTYHPLVRRTEKKRKSYARGIIEACVMILKYLVVFEGLDLDQYEKPEALKVDWPRMLPKDESLELQIELEKLNAGLTSKAQVLRDMYNWPEEKIEKVLSESEEDQVAQQQQAMQAQYDMGVPAEGGGMPPKGGGMPMSNTETDTPKGAMNNMKRQTMKGPDGKGRPKGSKN